MNKADAQVQMLDPYRFWSVEDKARLDHIKPLLTDILIDTDSTPFLSISSTRLSNSVTYYFSFLFRSLEAQG